MTTLKTPGVVGVIPARWGSTRFPGKSLASVCGKPLVQWVYERAAAAASLRELAVATDDARIRDAVEAFGGRVVMTRADHPSGTDRVAEAAAAMQAHIVVNIQGDEPLIDPALIDALADRLAGDESWDMATAAAPAAPGEIDVPSVVKVVTAQDGAALYFSRAAIPHCRDGAAPAGLYRRHIGIYAYRRTFLERLVATPPSALEEAEKLEQLRALDIGARICVLPADGAGVGVDLPADVARAEEALRAAGLA